MGGGSGHKSGGGSSGQISWPKYMHNVHIAMMYGMSDDGADLDEGLISTKPSDYTSETRLSVVRDAIEMHELSPFQGEIAFDPETRLDNMSTDLTNFTTDIARLRKSGETAFDWETLIARVQAYVDGTLLDSTDEQGVIDAWEANRLDAYYDAVNRFVGPMADIGATMSSAFIMGMAHLEQARQRGTDEFTANVRQQAYKDRLMAIQQGVRDMVQLLMQEYQLIQSHTGMSIDYERSALIAEKEENHENVELQVRDAQWELEIWQYPANILAAISGGVGSPTHAIPRESDKTTALGNIASGAATGAMVGAPFGGGLGAGIGAVIGGAAGVFL